MAQREARVTARRSPGASPAAGPGRSTLEGEPQAREGARLLAKIRRGELFKAHRLPGMTFPGSQRAQPTALLIAIALILAVQTRQLSTEASMMGARPRRATERGGEDPLAYIPPVIQRLGFREAPMSWRENAASRLGIAASNVERGPLIQSSPLLGRPAGVRKIVGDGSCFYRALSASLTGSEEFAPQVRAAVVRYMFEEKPSLISEDVLSEQDIMSELRLRGRRSAGLSRTQLLDMYKQHMSSSSSFATSRELDAAAELIGGRIAVYVPAESKGRRGAGSGRPSLYRSSWQIHSYKHFDDDYSLGVPAVYLINTKRIHFDVVTSVHVPTPEEGSD
ncbi:OTU family cysteine protease [Besnoitia besnoiti]|uniref:OTU family cysteine protease n=1 Tax=Besnoitia besnoiti TaxID=94643 RepID=A0A2A9MAF4_BESBE|nr:OTU family cysteine protease [Besnoitia besnoiti]PFH34879.1 OTU family cysteine protease [Besnoitia besnoiti]